MKKILLFMSITVFILSCETVVEFRVDYDENTPVLNAVISPSGGVAGFMSLTQNPLDDGEAKYLAGATVSIFVNDVLYTTSVTDTAGNFYVFFIAINPGDEFRLEATKEGYPTVSGTALVPDYVQFDTVFVSDIVTIDDQQYHKTHVWFTDPAGQDYYSLIVQYYNSGFYNICYKTTDYIFDDGNSELEIGSDPYITNCDERYFTDKLFDNTQKEIIAYIPVVYDDLTMYSCYFTLKHLSKDYYTYLVTTTLQESTYSNPFAEPANVFSNIENGYGICGTYTTGFTGIAF